MTKLFAESRQLLNTSVLQWLTYFTRNSTVASSVPGCRAVELQPPLASACRRGLVVHAWLQCERTQVRISPWAVFVTTASAICSLGHRLQILIAVPKSIYPCTLYGMVKWVSSFGLSNLYYWHPRWVQEFVCDGADTALCRDAYAMSHLSAVKLALLPGCGDG